jgi:hypothetical protein
MKDSKIADEFIIRKILNNMSIDSIDLKMLSEFKKLNVDGKTEAINRIIELTYVPKYIEEV